MVCSNVVSISAIELGGVNAHMVLQSDMLIGVEY